MTNETHKTVDTDNLRDFAVRLFMASQVPEEDARLVASVLVWANLRGVDSHGVLRIPGYLARLDNGLTNPRPDMKLVTDAPAAAVLDADSALGQIALARASSLALGKASETGLGACFIRRTTHMGAIGYFALEIAAEGMAAVLLGSSRPNMIYPGAKAAGVSTSPIAIAAPGAEHAPLMLDMATATASVGKIAHARQSGLPLGEGWAVDAEGQPTTDPSKAAHTTPLGGHKGGGLALMFECLTSLVIANPLIAPALEDEPGGRHHMQNGLVLAIDISRFTDVLDYAREIDRLAETIKNLPRTGSEILVPGERGDRIMEIRTRHGIPLAEGTWVQLKRVARSLGVELPAV